MVGTPKFQAPGAGVNAPTTQVQIEEIKEKAREIVETALEILTSQYMDVGDMLIDLENKTNCEFVFDEYPRMEEKTIVFRGIEIKKEILYISGDRLFCSEFTVWFDNSWTFMYISRVDDNALIIIPIPVSINVKEIEYHDNDNGE